MDYLALAQNCAPDIDAALVVRLIERESGFNPFAIGLDGRAALRPQPRNFDEAVQAAERLIREGKTFSVGSAQLHITNVRRLRLTWRQVFHPCTNLRYGQTIFLHFHRQAIAAGLRGDDAVFAALRGYNSGRIHGSVSNGYATAILARPTALQAASSPGKRPFAPRRAVAVVDENESPDFFDEP